MSGVDRRKWNEWNEMSGVGEMSEVGYVTMHGPHGVVSAGDWLSAFPPFNDHPARGEADAIRSTAAHPDAMHAS